MSNTTANPVARIIEDHWDASLEHIPLDKLADALRALKVSDDDLKDAIEQVVQMRAVRSRLDHHQFPELDDAVPTVFGSWTRQDHLGRGGTGDVYRVHNGRDVGALKVVRRDVDDATQEVFAVCLRREIELARLIRHRSFPKYLDSKEDGSLYLVREYVEGQPLLDFCRIERMTTQEKVRLLIDVSKAVAHLHRKHGIYHGDLKPENIFVVNSNSKRAVKIIDLGLAQTSEPELLRRWQVLGVDKLRGASPNYASPEQLQQHALTYASDVYSLGVIMYRLLSGKQPYNVTALTFGEAAEQALVWEYERIHSKEFGISRRHDDICRAALRRHPARFNYANAAEFAHDLRTLLKRGNRFPRASRYRTAYRKYSGWIKGLVAASLFLLTILFVFTMYATRRFSQRESELALLYEIIASPTVKEAEFESVYRKFMDLKPTLFGSRDSSQITGLRLWLASAASHANRHDTIPQILDDDETNRLQVASQTNPSLKNSLEQIRAFRAEAFLKQQRLNEAEREYQHINKFGPNGPSFWQGMAVVRKARGDEIGASECLVEWANHVERNLMYANQFERIGAYSNRVHALIRLERSRDEIEKAFSKLKSLVDVERRSASGLALWMEDQFCCCRAEYGRWRVELGSRGGISERSEVDLGFQEINAALEALTLLSSQNPDWKQGPISIMEIRTCLSRAYVIIGDDASALREQTVITTLGADFAVELEEYLKQIDDERKRVKR